MGFWPVGTHISPVARVDVCPGVVLNQGLRDVTRYESVRGVQGAPLVAVRGEPRHSRHAASGRGARQADTEHELYVATERDGQETRGKKKPAAMNTKVAHWTGSASHGVDLEPRRRDVNRDSFLMAQLALSIEGSGGSSTAVRRVRRHAARVPEDATLQRSEHVSVYRSLNDLAHTTRTFGRLVHLSAQESEHTPTATIRRRGGCRGCPCDGAGGW